MLSRCVICGKRAVGRCKYCGDALCEEHLPPEKHWCVAYYDAIDAGRASSEHSDMLEYEYKTSVFSIFSNNCSLLLLIAISVSFMLQLIFPLYERALALSPLFLYERPWTLVTYIFLHANFTHFLMNALFFIFFAPVLEREVGSKRFLAIFFISGIAAGVGWCLTTSYPFAVVVGASGALFGIFGALAVLAPRMKILLFFFLPMELWLAALLCALLEFLLSFNPSDPIAHTAHLSGLFVGMLAGEIIKNRGKRHNIR